MKSAIALLSWISLGVCIVAPVLRFLGSLDEAPFKTILFIASLGWFVFATLKESQSGATNR